MNVDVCDDQHITLPLLIVKGKGVSLFDKNWLEEGDWPAIHKLQENSAESILNQCAAVKRSYTLKASKLKCIEVQQLYQSQYQTYFKQW